MVKYENYNEDGHPDSEAGKRKGDGALFGPIGTRKYPFSWPQYYTWLFNDAVIKECGAVGRIRTEKGQ